MIENIKTFSSKIWLILLIGVVMIAALILSAEYAPAVAIAEDTISAEAVCTDTLLAERVAVEVVEEESVEEVAAAEISEEEDEDSAFLMSLCYFLEDIIAFNLYNADPTAVSFAHYFSGYLGQIVLFSDRSSRRSGSFGRLMSLYSPDKNYPETIKHEHGHFEQFLQIGLVKYIFAIAIPSILHQPDDYYSQPWEVTADLLGGVTSHYHSPGSEEAGWAYLNRVKNAGILSVIMDSLQ